MNIYEQNGYNDREEYLRSLANWHGHSEDVVFELAAILGPSEDFDGLVTSLEDLGDYYDFKEGACWS